MSGTTRREQTNRGGGGAQRSGRGGGSGGGRGRQDSSREVQVSKALSFLLRHGAKDAGVELDDGGWANLADVLAWRRLSNLSVTLSDIQALVATNDKQRFALKLDPSYHALPTSRSPGSFSTSNSAANNQASIDPRDSSAYLIRASQGHSLRNVSSEKLLSPMLLSDPKTPRLVLHGTYTRPWESIKESGGLKPMSRRHIHFATNLPSALPPLSKDRPLKVPIAEGGGDVVLSGMRRDATVLVWVDVQRSAQGGVKWWRSANGVVLTEGVEGLLGMEWVVWVERRGTGDILYGTKPPGGAATFGVEAGDEEGKALVAGEDRGNGHTATEALAEQELQRLDVRDNNESSNGELLIGGNENTGEAARAELKDNWDD